MTYEIFGQSLGLAVQLSLRSRVALAVDVGAVARPPL